MPPKELAKENELQKASTQRILLTFSTEAQAERPDEMVLSATLQKKSVKKSVTFSSSHVNIKE